MKTSTRIQLVARCVGLALIGGAVLSSHVLAGESSDSASITVKLPTLIYSHPQVSRRSIRESIAPRARSANRAPTAISRS